jgi:hypothetical protein
MNFAIPDKQPPRRSHRKRLLYQLLLARSDITAAQAALKLFCRDVDDLGHPLYYPLVAAMTVCYARPFTRNEPLGPLPRKWGRFNHPKAQQTHVDLMRARHQLIAHSDMEARQAKVVPPNFTIAHDKEQPIVSDFPAIQIGADFFGLDFYRINVALTTNELLIRLNEAIEPMVDELYGGMDLPARPFVLRIDDDGL